MSAIKAMPSSEMSSRRPIKGLTIVAPALAARSACPAEKVTVTLVLIPSLLKTCTAWRPVAVIGTLT